MPKVTKAQKEITEKLDEIAEAQKALHQAKKALLKLLPPEDSRMLKCSHGARPRDDPLKCGWLGRMDKYATHLKQFHGGKEYKEPKFGIPIEE